MENNRLEGLANEKLARLVSIKGSPRTWIYSVFGLVLFAAFIIFIWSQYGSNATFCECKSLSSRGRILNGVAVQQNEMRWVASVYNLKIDPATNDHLYFHICSAALITPQYLLLSTYCNRKTGETGRHYAAVGGTNRSLTYMYFSESNFRAIDKYIVPEVTAPSPNITGRQQVKSSVAKASIALAKLEKPFVLGDRTNIYPACLLERSISEFQNDLILAGYGEKADPSPFREHTITKNQINHIIQSQLDLWMTTMKEAPNCRKNITNFDASNEICTEYQKGSVLLEGDQAAPLHYEADPGKLYVVGVEISNKPIRNVLFDRVYPHLKWIDSIVGAERCTDVRRFAFSFKKFLWFLLVVLLACAAALTALYYMDRPTFEKIRNWFDNKVAEPVKRKLSRPNAAAPIEPAAQ